jgi:hypothetical protein
VHNVEATTRQSKHTRQRQSSQSQRANAQELTAACAFAGVGKFIGSDPKHINDFPSKEFWHIEIQLKAFFFDCG